MLSDLKTQAQLRLRVRRELKDANEHLVSPKRWWTDAELNEYLDEWVADLNRQFQLVTTSTTITVGSATNSVATPASMLRLDRAFWDNKRLLPATRYDMDYTHPGWQNETAQPGVKPTQIINIDQDLSLLYPIPGTTGSLYLAGPAKLSMTSDSSVCPIPPWMYWSCRVYCAYLAYLRAGPNQDIRKASRYKARYERMKKFYRQVLDGRWAAYGKSLKVGGTYEGSILGGRGR